MSAASSKRKELGALIAGKSDREIVVDAQKMGIEKVLGPVFDGMREAFMAKKAQGQAAVIQYDVDVGGTVVTYQVKVRDGVCTTSRDGSDPPRLTISAKLPDFLRVMAGELHEVRAFFTGRLKLSGELTLAAKMQRWFLE